MLWHAGHVCTASWHAGTQKGIKKQPIKPPKKQIRSAMSHVIVPTS